MPGRLHPRLRPPSLLVTRTPPSSRGRRHPALPPLLRPRVRHPRSGGPAQGHQRQVLHPRRPRVGPSLLHTARLRPRPRRPLPSRLVLLREAASSQGRPRGVGSPLALLRGTGNPLALPRAAASSLQLLTRWLPPLMRSAANRLLGLALGLARPLQGTATSLVLQVARRLLGAASRPVLRTVQKPSGQPSRSWATLCQQPARRGRAHLRRPLPGPRQGSRGPCRRCRARPARCAATPRSSSRRRCARHQPWQLISASTTCVLSSVFCRPDRCWLCSVYCATIMRRSPCVTIVSFCAGLVFLPCKAVASGLRGEPPVLRAPGRNCQSEPRRGKAGSPCLSHTALLFAPLSQLYMDHSGEFVMRHLLTRPRRQQPWWYPLPTRCRLNVWLPDCLTCRAHALTGVLRRAGTAH